MYIAKLILYIMRIIYHIKKKNHIKFIAGL